MKAPICKHRSPWKVMETRQCERKAMQDGYCTRHHPNYISPSQRRAMEDHERPNRLLEEAEMDVKEAQQAVEDAEDELMNAKAVLGNAERRYESMRSK